MDIPLSDHQMVANLVAFASLIIAAIAVLYSLRANKRTQQVAQQAIRQAAEANKLTKEALQILKSDNKIKDVPDLSVKFHVSKISRISSDSDFITFTVINESHSAIVIERIYIPSPFKGQLYSPSTLNYKEEKMIRIYIDESNPSSLSNLSRSSSDDIETVRQKVEELVIKSTVTVQAINEANKHFDIDFAYNPIKDQFEGKLIPISYRSKYDAEKLV